MNNPVLVVADDGSPGADAVWLWLAEQRWPGWSVKVVTVADAHDQRCRGRSWLRCST
jgi:hypothetical protein